jgi:hypothetical protein
MMAVFLENWYERLLMVKIILHPQQGELQLDAVSRR